MNDLTLLYYTANTISDVCAGNVRKHLLEITQNKIPIISVSQKPIDFGINICVGNIGKSYYNCYKQILTGAKEVKTKFVACCEDDTLYTMEHFAHRPSADDVFSYDLNWWYAEDKTFWHKTEINDTGMCFCICSTHSLIKTLKPRFNLYPSAPPINAQRYWQEPGRFDRKFGIPDAKFEYFKSSQPSLVFNYYGSLGGKRTSWRPRVFAESLSPWGDAKTLWKKYWKEKL